MIISSFIRCSKWQHGVEKSRGFFSQTKNSFKTSHWNHLRGRGYEKNSETQQYAISSLKKPLFFTIAMSGFSIAGAAIWEYENHRYRYRVASKVFGSQYPKYGSLRRQIHKWWQSRSEADKAFLPICIINVVVFLAWQIPALHPIMSRYFLSGLASKAVCWPMLLSVFSHYSLLHLGANMFVLHSFSEKAVKALGKEQFVGVYLSAGVISSFTSHFYKFLIQSSNTSLGASGAVMCILGYVCSKYPDSRLAIIFLPQFSFDAATGLKGILCLDFIGCVLRWTFLDHAAHLGGSLFGIIWYNMGQDLIWKKRRPLVEAWHKLRGN